MTEPQGQEPYLKGVLRLLVIAVTAWIVTIGLIRAGGFYVYIGVVGLVAAYACSIACISKYCRSQISDSTADLPVHLRVILTLWFVAHFALMLHGEHITIKGWISYADTHGVYVAVVIFASLLVFGYVKNYVKGAYDSVLFVLAVPVVGFLGLFLMSEFIKGELTIYYLLGFWVAGYVGAHFGYAAKRHGGPPF